MVASKIDVQFGWMQFDWKEPLVNYCLLYNVLAQVLQPKIEKPCTESCSYNRCSKIHVINNGGEWKEVKK